MSIETDDSQETADDIAPLPLPAKAPLWSRQVSFRRGYSDGSDGKDPTSPAKLSTHSSWMRFGEPAQTLIFFDWDDTLFPTTEICDRWGLKPGDDVQLSDEQEALLLPWRQALHAYLSTATSLGRVVILTNSRRPWVDHTRQLFAPNLDEIFESKDGPKVVYAREVMEDMRRKKKLRAHSPTPVKYSAGSDSEEDDETQQRLMQAKFEGMREEAKAFYRLYPGQTWKNIISLGDMWYEHEASQELALRRRPVGKENLRVKSLLLPCAATLTEITLRLKFSRIMLPVYIHFDGDLRVDLQTATNPIAELAEALGLPSLADTNFPLHAWGRGTEVNEQATLDALQEVAMAVHSSWF